MNLKKSIYLILLPLFIISSCKKNTSCPSVTLCPSVNPAYFAVNGIDTASIYMPNAFSPNGDGINDWFFIFGNKITSLKCDIYNGSTLVYEIDSLNQHWDGYINGKNPVNLYTLKLTATTTWGAQVSLNGTLSSIGGAFLGDTSVHITMNTYASYLYAQFPDQNRHGYYDPSLPPGEYLIIDSVIVCH